MGPHKAREWGQRRADWEKQAREVSGEGSELVVSFRAVQRDWGPSPGGFTTRSLSFHQFRREREGPPSFLLKGQRKPLKWSPNHPRPHHPRTKDPWKPGAAPRAHEQCLWGGRIWKPLPNARFGKQWIVLSGPPHPPHPPFNSLKFSPSTKLEGRIQPMPQHPTHGEAAPSLRNYAPLQPAGNVTHS